ncbi:MAG: hypothetical protein GX162_04955 [Firmicutes bacterium]|jgi:uncharacterized membrane protein|nr:hypothetical protein [Bacillota bacterium]
MWIRFVIYGLLGWAVEITWTGLGALWRGDPRLPGRTYLWMFIVYGSAALVLEPVHNLIGPWPWPYRGLVWTFSIFFIEYAAGWLLRELTGVCPWDYTSVRFSIRGLIRLDYAPAWFVLGLFFERLHRILVILTPSLMQLLRPQ